MSAPARIFRDGSPAVGFVRWHCETLPPKTVAQEVNMIVTAMKGNNRFMDQF